MPTPEPEPSRASSSQAHSRWSSTPRAALSCRPALREFASLKGDAVVVGALDHIELWEPGRWSAAAEDMSSDDFAERIAGLGI